MGPTETVRSGRVPAGESLGTVWIYCSNPVVLAGLGSAFEERARVHLGQSAPAGGVAPACAIFDTAGAENLSEGIRLIQEVSPEIPILVFGLHVDLPRWSPPEARSSFPESSSSTS